MVGVSENGKRSADGAAMDTTSILILIARLLGTENGPVPHPVDPGEHSSVPGAVVSRTINPRQPSHEFGSAHSRKRPPVPIPHVGRPVVRTSALGSWPRFRQLRMEICRDVFLARAGWFSA